MFVTLAQVMVGVDVVTAFATGDDTTAQTGTPGRVLVVNERLEQLILSPLVELTVRTWK